MEVQDWTWNIHSGTPRKSKALILAPTRVAVIYIYGTTINSRLSIPQYVNGYTLPRLSDSGRTRLHNLYSEVAVVFIDEISMFLNIRLLHIYKRLCEIFGCLESQRFGNFSLLVIGDLIQFPPIQSLQIFEKCHNTFGNFFSLSSLFFIVELLEEMRKIGNQTFIDLLNNIRLGGI